MGSPYEKIRDLLALANQENEEGRTAAHLAIKLIKKHGFVLTVSTKSEAPDPQREPYAPPAYQPPAPRARPSPPTATPARWGSFAGIVLDEAVQFMRTIDVLPRDIPIYGVQLVPADKRGRCSCGHTWQRGEMISRGRVPVCASCVAERSRIRNGGLLRRAPSIVPPRLALCPHATRALAPLLRKHPLPDHLHVTIDQTASAVSPFRLHQDTAARAASAIFW